MKRIIGLISLLSGLGMAQVHFEPVPPTGKPYTIIISEISGADTLIPHQSEVAVFDDTLCVGAALFDSLESFHCIAWEADPAHNLPGFTAGHPITLRIWNAHQGNWSESEAGFEIHEGDGTFGYGLYTRLTLLLPQYPTALHHQQKPAHKFQLFPNPVNGAFTLRWSEAPSGNLKLTLYDLKGRLYLQRFVSHQATNQPFVLRIADALPSGVYIVSLSASSATVHQKLIIQK